MPATKSKASSRSKKPKSPDVYEDDLVFLDDREEFVVQCLKEWALKQFRDDKPCRITVDHAKGLRERAERLYDRLFIDQ